MSKWHSLLEILQFPLKILFIGTFLLGLGTIVVNQNVDFLWHFDNTMILRCFELIRYIGAVVVYLFPLLVFIQVLSHKYESPFIVIEGVLSYILIDISMVFFLNSSYPAYFYQSIFNFTTINFDQIKGVISTTILPFNIGVLGFVLAYAITHWCYMRSRKYSIFGILSFVDHDTMAGILCSFFSVLCGIVIAFAWPLIIQMMMAFYDIIASDISNPVNLLLYGMHERLSAMLGMIDIPRQLFWFTDKGGSWLNNVGLKFSGDVAIWTAQKEAGMSALTSGVFITPYYVINLFLIPSFYIGYYHLCSNKDDKKRYIGFFVIAILLSVLCGNPLPAEIVMLILSPMLYVIYIFIVGLLYALLQMMHVVIGYNFSELMILANPGSGLDLLEGLRNPYLVSSIIKLVLIGIMAAILFYYLTKTYFNKYAFGMFQMVDKDSICADIVKSLGGIENIIDVESAPDKLMVRFVNRELVNYDELSKYGAYLMLESKNGYLIRIGNISTMVRNYILDQKKNGVQEFEPVKITDETKSA